MQSKLRIPEDEFEIKPLEIAETIPSSWYTSEDLLTLELDGIFTTNWQYVGHQSQVRTIGDHFIAEVGGEPSIVVCGKDEELRAFFNVCRHRGGPIAVRAGCSAMLTCKYHGWTYALDGSLRGVPDFDRVELFDKTDFGLVPIAVASWQGLIFVNLDSLAAPLPSFMDGVAKRIAPVDLARYQYHSRETFELQCNWKVYVDNYLEGYHVPLVHPELMKMYDFNAYATETFDWYSLQHCPLSGEENIYSSGEGEALYFHLFPNLMLNILPNRLQTNLVLPNGAERTIVHFDYFYAEGVSESLISNDLIFSDFVQKEDIEICELVQRGLRSRAYDKGRFSVKRENAVHHFQSQLKSQLRKKINAEPHVHKAVFL